MLYRIAELFWRLAGRGDRLRYQPPSFDTLADKYDQPGSITAKENLKTSLEETRCRIDREISSWLNWDLRISVLVAAATLSLFLIISAAPRNVLATIYAVICLCFSTAALFLSYQKGMHPTKLQELSSDMSPKKAQYILTERNAYLLELNRERLKIKKSLTAGSILPLVSAWIIFIMN
jgi:hypothetical protein